MADISKLKVTQNGASTEYNVKDTAARNAVAQVTQDLANYYLKSETYNKSEVDNLIAGIKQFTYVVAESLPTASASTMYKIYLIPSGHSVTSNVRDEYITIQDGSTYKWEQIGSTAADFSNYSTTEEMNAAIATELEDYYSKDEVDSLIVGLATDVRDDIQTLKEEVNDTYAKKDGDYETLGAGSATNLKGNTVSNAKFAFRTAGGSADIATGQAQLNVVRGNTVVWNQYVNFTGTKTENVNGITFTDNGDGSYTANGTATGVAILQIYHKIGGENIQNHKFYVRGCPPNGSNTSYSINDGIWYDLSEYGNGAIWNSRSYGFAIRLRIKNGATVNNLIFTPQAFDLTAMFGSGKEPTIEEFKAMFPKSYYPYSAPTLLSFRADGIKTVGFNQFNYATGKAKVIPNMEYQITGTYTSLSMNGETITPDSDGIFTPTQFGDVDVVGGNATTCIHLVWSGIRNGEFEEYWESRLDYPLTQLTGKLNGEGERVLVFPDGLRSVGNVRDEIIGNKAIKRVGSVNLGTLNWTNLNDDRGFYTNGIASFIVKTASRFVVKCAKYNDGGYYGGDASQKARADKTVTSNAAGNVFIKDSAYTDPIAFKTSLNGVILYYELATPQEYILDDFQLPAGYRVDDFGTEETYVSEGLTTPCDLDVVYGINAADTIRRLPDNYVSATEAQTFTESEKAQARKNIDAATPSGVYKEMVVGGALNLVDASDDSVPREFTFDTAGGVNDIGTGLAVLKRLNGNTIVWNQQISSVSKNPSLLPDSQYTETYANGIYTLTSPNITEDTVASRWIINTNLLATGGASFVGHKVLTVVNILSCVGYTPSSDINIGGKTYSSGSFRKGIFKYIGNYISVNSLMQYPMLQTGESGNNMTISPNAELKFTYNFFDLTLMFGAGNEPATVAEFEKLFPLDYYDYNDGSLLSFNGTGLKTTGFNQFNSSIVEEGSISTSNGTNIAGSSFWRIPNNKKLRVLPSTTYCISVNSGFFYRYEYDINGNFIKASQGAGHSGTFVFTTDANTHYLRVALIKSGLDTFCINLSWSGTKNGTYEPYEEHTLNYDISAIQDGEGNQLFPLGLLSAGDVHDELTAHKAIKRVGVVDMGTLNWTKTTSGDVYFYAPVAGIKYEMPASANINPNVVTSKYIAAPFQGFPDKTINTMYSYAKGVNIKDSSYSTAADFKAAMSGVMLYYELATPIEVDFDEQLNLSYNVNDWGTEELLPENTATPVTSPAKFDIVYNVNAVDTLKNLSRNFLAEADLDRLLTALGTALGFTYTKTWNQETKEWSFTVTPTSEGE